MDAASKADAYSPNAFNFHLNFLYTHGMDDAAAKRLSSFAQAVPDHPSIASMKSVIANTSAPMLRQRGQTINGQIARMREGAPVAITPVRAMPLRMRQPMPLCVRLR